MARHSESDPRVPGKKLPLAATPRQATSAGDSNPLPVISAVMIIAGLFRVFYSLYRFLKLLSGKARGSKNGSECSETVSGEIWCDTWKVLESAEGMILETWQN